jgi:hypothetical protein
MEKEFLPHRESLELKELGFNEPCFRFFYSDGRISDNLANDIISKDYINTRINVYSELNSCSAPTFSQAFKWFREKYDLHNGIYPYYDEYEFQIKDFRLPTNTPIHGGLMKYEEAELACLRKLIEICKINE